MPTVKINKIALLAVCMVLSEVACSQLRLPAFVRDSMVLQRDAPVRIWGWASKGEKITLWFRGRKYSTTAGSKREWSVNLSPMNAGGPFTMRIRGKNELRLKDILVGDVWLCSGQSNMVHQMSLHSITYEKEIASADYPAIRQFLVTARPNLQEPQDELASGTWKSAVAGDILQFSAVAYFFAKTIYEKYHVPIGLINASVGGSPIESWISEKGLASMPQIAAIIKKNRDTAYTNEQYQAALQWNARNKGVEDKGLVGKLRWYDTNYIPKNWQLINIPGYWEDQGNKDLDGIGWYRREVEIPASMTGVPATLFAGRIIDADIVYINGVQVGTTGYQYPQRRYKLPPGTLCKGKNIFVFRVTNEAGKGGFVPGKPYRVEAAGQAVDLKGYWDYKVGAVFNPSAGEPANFSYQNQPTALYNAMIAPLKGFSLRGIAWYQGESNASHPEGYDTLMRALIDDWRVQWKQPALPFLFVQLPNFGDIAYLPGQSEWAELREAQRSALSAPNTGMAVSIDLGEWNDIHPDNKEDIGVRLALVAEKVAYHEEGLVYSGPIAKLAVQSGSKVLLSFTNTGSGLVAKDGEPLQQFSIAGADRLFKWAKAEILDNQVLVWNNSIPEPKFVRYAWADNPAGANLYNTQGLPASPFTIAVSHSK